MQNYELKIYLTHLTLTATDGKIEWIGTEKEKEKANDLIEQYEKHE